MTGPDGPPTFDKAQRHAIDKVLSTTRAVRLRLDLHRPVPDEVLLDCIDLAEQAPCGAAQPSRRWLVVREQAARERIAGWYREIIHPAMRSEFGLPVPGDADFVAGGPAGDDQASRVFRSALHLAANLERVPVLVLCTIYGEHDQVGSPGLFDSVIQAGWSFCLAARSRGLGSTWTTAHLPHAAAVAELLGIPAGVTQVALFPVAWAEGEFRPAQRPSALDVTFFDRWGCSGPAGTVALDLDVAAEPDRLLPYLTAACRHLGEPVSAEEPGTLSWTDADRSWTFHARPRIYGGTRLNGTVRFAAGSADQHRMLATRDELQALLAQVKAAAENSAEGSDSGHGGLVG